eukprot:scaffold129698_cov23-Prasinocladus_malaysianus.AAC.1
MSDTSQSKHNYDASRNKQYISDVQCPWLLLCPSLRAEFRDRQQEAAVMTEMVLECGEAEAYHAVRW